MAISRTTTTKTLMDCPACHRPIVANMTLDLTLGAVNPSPGAGTPATVEAVASLVGLSIQHDCTPVTSTRDPHAHPTRPTPERTMP